MIKNIEVYGEMHRYIPVIAAHEGYNKIDEKIVQHQARQFGKTKFGVDRFLKGFLDLVTLWFVNGFGKRPMHFFGCEITHYFKICDISTHFAQNECSELVHRHLNIQISVSIDISTQTTRNKQVFLTLGRFWATD